MSTFEEIGQLIHTQKEKPSFWIRDDDLTAQNPKMDQILDVSASFKIPISLAVIPATMSKDLVVYTQNYPALSIVQHGICHENKAIIPQKKSEFVTFNDKQFQRLLSEKKRMEDLFGKSFKPIFVPPWNRMDRSWEEPILNHFDFISAFGMRDHLYYKNTHLDLINWKTRNFKTEDELCAELKILLHKTTSIGILTHHFMHEDKDWAMFRNMLNVLSGKI
jgi:hypothetical protein